MMVTAGVLGAVVAWPAGERPRSRVQQPFNNDFGRTLVSIGASSWSDATPAPPIFKEALSD